MVRSQEILNGIQQVVDSHSSIAVFWHVLFYVLIIALIWKWQPSNRLFWTIMCLPALSVSILAWINGNPFNGTLFAILTILILISGLLATVQPISNSQFMLNAAGILMVIFGLIYPHFIDISIIGYLYASPLGLIPCPTLSILIGFALIFNAPQSLNLIYIVFGLFYGIFGVLRLTVNIDIFLIFGAVTLLVKYILSMIK